MKFIKIKLTILIALIALTFLLSCEVTEPTEGLEVRLNTFSRETLVSGYLYDANTLQPVEENLSVIFTGNNASKIIDETNEPKAEFTAKEGVFVFGVSDGTQFSAASPFKVNVTVEANNYNTETQTISIKSKGYQAKNFYLVNPTNLPSNSENETFSAGNSDNSGTLTQGVQYTTSNGTIISFDDGTTMLDANGSPVSGNLTSQITIVPLTTGNQYNAPLNINTSSNETVNPILKFHFSVMDQSGNSVSDFSQVVNFSIPVPEDLVDHFGSGETIAIWKQNNSGTYNQVGEATLASSLQSGKGFAYVTESTIEGSTNSAGNLLFGNTESTCDASLTITNMPPGFNSSLQYFDENGTLLANNGQSTIDFEIPSDGLTIASVRLNAELSNPFNTGIEFGSNIVLQCGENSASLNFPDDLIGINIQIIGLCTEKDPVVVVNPNMTYSYRKEGSSTWHSGNLVNGESTVTGLEPGIYYVTASYRGKTGNAKFDIVDTQTVTLVEVSNPENLLSAEVDLSTSPATLIMEIDIEDECD